MKSTELLASLLFQARTTSDLQDILRGLDPLHYSWVPFDGDFNNKAQIHYGTDSLRSIGERGVNAQDALLERIVFERTGIVTTEGMSLPERRDAHVDSPTSAASFYLQTSEVETPTVFVDYVTDSYEKSLVSVWDQGTGISPLDFPKTILALSRSNKKHKAFTAGTYGQGGSSSLRFCDRGGVFIVSRSAENVVVFTLVRYSEPSSEEEVKGGHYEYLVSASGEILQDTTPYIAFTPSGLKRTPEALSEFPQGTLVKHLGYDLSNYKGDWGDNEGSVVATLERLFFATLVPLKLRIVEKAGGKADEKEVIDGKVLRRREVKGSRRRLNTGAAALDHKLPQTVLNIIIDGERYGAATIEYWLLKTGEKRDRYVRPFYPTVVTLNGQCHDEFTINEIDPTLNTLLPKTSDSLVIHVTLDGLNATGRDRLLSSTRERLQKGQVLSTIKRQIAEYLKADEVLRDIEDLRQQEEISKQTQKRNRGLINTVAQMLGKTIGNLLSDVFGDRTSSGSRKPLPKIDLHDPATYIKFVDRDITFYPGQSRHLAIETDAYSQGTEVTVGAIGLDLISQTSLSHGRMRVVVQCPNVAIVGQSGVLSVQLNTPGARPDMVTYTVVAKKIATIRPTTPTTPKGEKQAASIPEFNWIEIDPTHNEWPMTENGVKFSSERFSFTYRYPISDQFIVYFNPTFPDFKEARSQPGLEDSYKLDTMMYAFKHFVFQQGTTEDPSTISARNQIRNEERVCAASTFVRSAILALDSKAGNKLAKAANAD
jgi:hypothetical protein